MRIGRNIIISAILALSAGGSIAASVAVPATVAQGASVHAVAGSAHASPQTYFRG
jgi:hypothetical protein